MKRDHLIYILAAIAVMAIPSIYLESELKKVRKRKREAADLLNGPLPDLAGEQFEAAEKQEAALVKMKSLFHPK